ncbi:alpha/beta hydrolase [Cellulomonas palmilytica]|uniref:alpha/beta hydrolase n=1 Tax=Cellulomonas palmilytica TaxID=2608402 RepID=UPI001F3467D9|nr:alpha/beta hydrolase [Cellulomonas palmilytica]UJP40637.1 alpha/beta hydrolase [Cellulomonas palmilytica]
MSPVHDDVAAFRVESARYGASLTRALPHLPVGTYEVLDAGAGAPVRELMVYRPAGVAGPPPVLVNLHGGGFVLGEGRDDDPYCRFLADAAGCAVVNVDYLLAPEHPFPAAVHQVHGLLAWLAEHAGAHGLDGTRLAVAGHSAGGNLAAAAALLARRSGGPSLRGVVVDYAPLDLATPPAAKLTTAPDPGAVALADAGARFNAWYLADADPADELASPLLADDLSGLPPTLVLTAELDLLRAEGDRFAERLAEAGVPVEHVVHAGCGHAFTHVGPDDEAAAAWERIARFARRVLVDEAGA